MKGNSIINLYKSIKDSLTSNIYFLQGEEPYYIDGIIDYVEKKILADSQKGLDLCVLYGRDTNMQEIISYASKCPMISDKSIVIVKEAQNLSDLSNSSRQSSLASYVLNSNKHSILCFAYKGKKLNENSNLAKVLNQNGMLFTSNTLYDSDMPFWINNYVNDKNGKISKEAITLINELLGNNLQRIANEIDKMLLLSKDISYDLVEYNVSSTREFDAFDLQKALINRNVKRISDIIEFIDPSSKSTVAIQIINVLFNFFCKVIIIHTTKDKTVSNLSKILQIKPFFLNEYIKAAKVYSYHKSIINLNFLQKADFKLKGINYSSTDIESILTELVYRIL